MVNKMNKDFPRILTLLRTERGLSQKQVANDLNISQGLLSHYENGKRECNLDLLVRIAKYFDVSCDYLLGTTSMPISIKKIVKPKQKNKSISKALSEQLNKINHALEIFNSVIESYQNPELIQYSDSILSLSMYSLFRSAFVANSKNDKNNFSVNKESISPAFALLSSSFERKLEGMKINAPKTSFMKLYNEFPLEYKALNDIIVFSEEYIKKLDD